MKKFILSFALFMGFTSVQHSFAVSTPAGYEAAEWMRELAEAQNDTDSSLMRKFILIKHSPLFSLLGASYFGLALYSAFSEIERLLEYRNPESLEKLSPKARKVLKIITSSSFALLGAWLFARGYQNWQAGEAMLYNPPVMP